MLLIETSAVWTLSDDEGLPTFKNSDGVETIPFWSSRSRVKRMIKMVPKYSDYEPYEISWEEFCKEWVPDFEEQKIKVGVNWSGKRAKGFDIEPVRVVKLVEAVISNQQ